MLAPIDEPLLAIEGVYGLLQPKDAAGRCWYV